MTRTVWLAAAGVVLFSFASATLADAESDYKLLFGQDEAKVLARRNPKEIAAFAAKLLSAAKTVSEQKPLQNLLLDKAYDLAMRDAGGYDTAIEAAKLQMEADPAKKADARERLAKVLQLRFARSRGDERKAHGEELVGLLISGADELAAAGKPTEAADAYRQALSVATAARSDRTKEIMDKVRAINDAVQAEKKLAALKASLAADPKNVTARTTLILIYLGERDDPAEAAKLVTADLDERMRTYLPLAAKPVADLDEIACLELANWYADLADKASAAGKGILLGRAKEAAERFLELHTAQDVTRLKGKMLLDKVAKGAAEVDPRTGAGLPKALRLTLGRGVTMKLVLIPAGKFMMGSPDNEAGRAADEGPQREVTISKPFYMGAFEVTQAQYEAIMGVNPSSFKTFDRPVENIAWTDAAEFCRKATARTRRAVRLPTAAEWEYACRAGTTTRFSFGDDENEMGAYAKYGDRLATDKPSGARTALVGSFKPNGFGLYDMHGNVLEWCSDYYENSQTNVRAVDPTGPQSGGSRVIRGGSWYHQSDVCRSARRLGRPPEQRNFMMGFRAAVDAN